MTKELELILKLRDQASGPLRNVSGAAKEASSGLSTIVAAGKAAGVVAIATTAINAYSAGLAAYKTTLAGTGSVEIAQQARLEAIAHSIPVVAGLFDSLVTITGAKTATQLTHELELRTQQIALITDLTGAYERLVIAEEAARPGRSDLYRANQAGKIEMLAGVAAIDAQILGYARDAAKVQAVINDVAGKGDGSDINSEQVAEVARYNEQIAVLVKTRQKLVELEASGRANREGDQADADKRAAERERAKEDDLYLEFASRYGKNQAATRQKMLTEYGLTLRAELDALKANLDDKLNAIEQNAQKEKEKRAERAEELKKGKSDPDKAIIDARRKENDQLTDERAAVEADQVRAAAKVDEAYARGADARRDLLKDKADNDASNKQAIAARAALSSMLIDGLTREGELGNQNAKNEAERLKITEEMIVKRKALQDLITDPNTSAADRARAAAGLFNLSGDEKRRKALVGLDAVSYGTTAAANSGFGGSGVAEAARERATINPMVEEQRKANEALAEAVKLLNDLPAALKALGISLVAKGF